MEMTLRKKLSPRSSSGSFLMAVLAHGAIYGALLLYFGIRALHPDAEPALTEELTYETFNEVPTIAPVVKRAAKAPEEDVQKEVTKPDNSPKELQDASSTIAGTQKAAKTQTASGDSGTGEVSATPYYKIKPKYPRAALASGVEGWVEIKVDIDEQGSVQNLRVIGGEQRSMFQDEARRAVEKWKYKPFLDANGKPVKKSDHVVRVDFKLKEATI